MINLEWALFWRPTANRAALVAFVLTLGGALFSGHAHLQRQQLALAQVTDHETQALAEARENARRLDSGELTSIGTRSDPREAANFGNQVMVTYAVRPPQPLAIASVGQSDLHARYVRLNLGPRDKALGSVELSNPEATLSGPFDLAFVIVYLLPLVVIALGQGIGASERERGTAFLLAVSTPQPPHIWRQRLMLRLGAVLVPALAAIVVAALMAPAATRGASAVPAWLLFGTLTTIQVLFWGGITGLVASRARSAQTSALQLVSVWLLMLVVVPAIANVVARSVAPVPSRAEFIQGLRDATDGVEARRAQVLDRFFFDHPELAHGGVEANAVPAALARLITTRAVEAEAAQIDARYSAQLNRQQRVIDAFQIVAPPLALQSAFDRLAATDFAWQRDFVAQTVRHHDQLRDFFEPLLAAAGPSPRTSTSPDAGSLPPSANPGARAHFAFPRFQYETPPALALPTPASGLGALVMALLGGVLLWRMAATATVAPRVSRPIVPV